MSVHNIIERDIYKPIKLATDEIEKNKYKPLECKHIQITTLEKANKILRNKNVELENHFKQLLQSRIEASFAIHNGIAFIDDADETDKLTIDEMITIIKSLIDLKKANNEIFVIPKTYIAYYTQEDPQYFDNLFIEWHEKQMKEEAEKK